VTINEQISQGVTPAWRGDSIAEERQLKDRDERRMAVVVARPASPACEEHPETDPALPVDPAWVHPEDRHDLTPSGAYF
jgi:hypothetical protein